MEWEFGVPRLADLAQIMRIENAGFSPEEAAKETAMAERIETIADSFIVARNGQGEVVGYIVGPVVSVRYITDELFKQSRPNPQCGGFQTVLSLAVAPEYQGKGIAGQLVGQLLKQSRAAGREAVTLTCLAELIPFYERQGFKNEGVSDSQHAGERWYNLVYDLSA